MADLDSSAQLAKEALDELRQAGSLSAKTLDKLHKAAKDLTKDVDKSTDAIEDETKAREKLTKDLIGLARNIGSAAQAVRENREDFRSLAPAVDAAASGVKMSLGGLANGIDSVGKILSGIGAALPGWGKLVGVFGGAVSGASKLVSKYGAEAVDAAAQYAKFSLEEMQRVVGGFRTLGEVGGITGDSFRGLMKDAQALGISVDTYAKLVARNAEGLASATGTVTGGTQVLKQITTAGTEFEDKFLKLGYSFEQQSEFSAKFLAQQRNLTRINLDDTKALSEANRKYLEQVDELARLTGQSREKVAGELEAMSRELRFGATLAIAEQKGTADNIRKAAKVIEAQGSKELAEGFKDIFGGATTERSQGLMAATGGAAAQLADDLENGRITFAEFMQKFQQSVRETRQALGADEFERRVGKLGTVLDPMLVGMRRLDKAQDLNAESLGKAAKEQKEAGETRDEETQKIVDAQKSLRDLAVTLDKIVSDKLFPTMADSVKFFTGVIRDGADTIAKILGVEPKVPGRVPVPQITGSAVNERRRAAGQPELSPEAAEAQAAREQVQQEMARRNASRAARRQQNAQPATPASGPTSAAPGTDPLAGLNIKSGESVAGGQADPRLISLARQIQEMYPNATFTALNDLYHQANNPNSAHTRGRALDFSLNPAPRNVAEAAVIKDALRQLGFSTVKDEYFADRNRFTTGGHFHAELAYGGIVSGPKSGYASLLHGTEAVIPLPGGRNVPVEMTGVSDKMGEQVSILTEQVGRFDQMINLLQSSVDMQGKIYRATVG